MSESADIVYKLEHWFRLHQRALPWRIDYAPYKVWVSEIMLQQTRVETVVDYYNRWMDEFPDIYRLADSSEEVVLKCWEGLGYYSRGRNLFRAAKIIVESFGGKIPDDPAVLRTLPGIGAYTAGAISSIAYEKKSSCLDGNIKRFLSRLTDWKEEVNSRRSTDFLTGKAEELLEYADPRILNQAMMEIGALICLRATPKCDLCPIKDLCLAKRNQTQNLRPVQKPPPDITRQIVIYLVFTENNQFYLEKQPEKSWWKGMWCFPYVRLDRESASVKKIKEIVNEYRGNHLAQKLIQFVHSVTRYRLQSHAFLLQNSQYAGSENEGKWFTLEQLEQLALPKSGMVIRDRLKQGR